MDLQQGKNVTKRQCSLYLDITKDKIHTSRSISEGKPIASNDVNGGGTLSP